MSVYSKKENTIALTAIILLVAAVGFLLRDTGRIGDTINTERIREVRTILDAVYQYAIDQGGIIPAEITTSLQMIGTDNSGCAVMCGDEKIENDSCIDLSEKLVNDYVIAVPQDPIVGTSGKTHYAIKKTEGGKLNVVACVTNNNRQINAGR